MIAAWALVSPDNKLELGTIRTTRAQAESLLAADFPPGHLIYPGYRVVKIRIDVE